MTESRYCSNCRARLAPHSNACPECGVFAGAVFDGRKPRPPKKPSGFLFGLLVIAMLAGAVYWFQQDRQAQGDRQEPQQLPSTRVVADRPGGARRAPGAAITEAEAVRLLRRHLVETTQIKNDCIAMIRDGSSRTAYVFTVVNRCENIRLGRWRVDEKTGAVARAR